MTDFELDFDGDFDALADFDTADAAELDEAIAALDREGGVEAAFRAAVREELEGLGDRY